MSEHKVYSMTFASIYNSYLNKITRKNRTEEELNDILIWLTNYTAQELAQIKESDLTLKQFIQQAHLTEERHRIMGSIRGIKIAEIKEHLMKEIRYMDKVVDELARGKAIDKIKRKAK